MGVYKRGSTWYIDYYDQYGRRHREAVGRNKRQAEQALAKRKTEVAEGKFLDKKKQEKIKFKDFAKIYLDVYAKPNKKSWGRDGITISHLNKCFGGKYLHKITALDIEDYKRRRLEKVNASTVNRELTCLKTLFSKAVQWKKVQDNPAKDIKKIKEKNHRLRYLTKEEIKALYDASAEHLKPILIVALNAGMRKGEILQMKWEDIDLDRKIIYIINTKNNEKREIPMNKALHSTLRKLKKDSDSSYVFTNSDGKPYGDVKKAFASARKRAGIENFRFHDLRHTFASHLVMAGVDLNTVKELLGHKDIKMTQRYAHLSPDHKARAVETLCSGMDTIWSQSQKSQNLENP